MSLAQNLKNIVPSVRVFFTILTGNTRTADTYISRFLKTQIDSSDSTLDVNRVRVSLFRHLIVQWQQDGAPVSPIGTIDGSREAIFVKALNSCTLHTRTICLLVYMADFSRDETSQILDLPHAQIDASLTEFKANFNSRFSP